MPNVTSWLETDSHKHSTGMITFAAGQAIDGIIVGVVEAIQV